MVVATNCGDCSEIVVLMQVSVRFDTNLERDTVDGIASSLAPLFERGDDVPFHRIGLYLASSDAGIATSVRFWSEAQRTGLAMASPELFPWCLANAPAAALARRFGITGPNHSLLGEGDALLAVINAARDDLTTERIDAAVVMALEMRTGRCSGLRLARSAAAATQIRIGGGPHDPRSVELHDLAERMGFRA